MSRDAFTLEFTDAAGQRRRVRYIPICGAARQWTRVESEYRGVWRETGREPVTNFELVDTAELLK